MNLIIEMKDGRIIAYHWQSKEFFCAKVKDGFSEVELKYYDYNLDKFKETKEKFCANPWCSTDKKSNCDLKVRK